jgi:ribonuclease HI
VTNITIYTDGAARGNPGQGGYGVVLISGPNRKEISGGFSHTTNNRMELLAAIVGLKKTIAMLLYIPIRNML